MVSNEILIAIIIGLCSGSLVGLLSIGGGVIIIPLVHYLYPEIAYNDIIIISIHQIFLSSLITFITHKNIQEKKSINLYWLIIHILCLVCASCLTNYLDSEILVNIFVLFILISIVARCAFYQGITIINTPSIVNLFITTCASIGTLVGLGGSIMLYPLLRMMQQQHPESLKLCALSSLTVGVVGVISHDVIYLFNYNAHIPWDILITICTASILSAKFMALQTYRLSSRTIDNISLIVSILVVIFYYFFQQTH